MSVAFGDWLRLSMLSVDKLLGKLCISKVNILRLPEKTRPMQPTFLGEVIVQVTAPLGVCYQPGGKENESFVSRIRSQGLS
jgi:hypothetical protein